jgi:hypothetical protein
LSWLFCTLLKASKLSRSVFSTGGVVFYTQCESRTIEGHLFLFDFRDKWMGKCCVHPVDYLQNL